MKIEQRNFINNMGGSLGGKRLVEVTIGSDQSILDHFRTVRDSDRIGIISDYFQTMLFGSDFGSCVRDHFRTGCFRIRYFRTGVKPIFTLSLHIV